ncbi:DUF423 domain-containing protein [Sphingomonas silueang]|uniref:DUF423 domain-containing protein n=1 Tax=Sphingomonas silueang TaxID=3156617 RepID=UPI0032B5F786
MNLLLLAAALSGAMAVAAGAFGAHGASSPAAAEWLRTGAQYQLVHAVAAIVALQLGTRGPGWAFVAGGLLFGGSLYAMALGGPRGILGPVTPLGGLAMIVGWLWLAWQALRR